MDAKTLCLGVLMLGDASGYEIRKMFEEGPFAHFQDVGYGSIYPSLARLAEEGLVAISGAPADGHPEKKVYRATEAGRAAFRDALGRMPGPDKVRSDTCFLMFFAEHLEADHLRRVYDGYLSRHREMIAFMKTLSPEGVSKGRQFVRGLGLAYYEAVAAYMEANRHLLLDDRGGTQAAD